MSQSLPRDKGAPLPYSLWRGLVFSQFAARKMVHVEATNLSTQERAEFPEDQRRKTEAFLERYCFLSPSPPEGMSILLVLSLGGHRLAFPMSSPGQEGVCMCAFAQECPCVPICPGEQ